MKIITAILILVIIVLIAWNLFPIILGLVKFLIGLGFIFSFIAGIFVGTLFNKKQKNEG